MEHINIILSTSITHGRIHILVYIFMTTLNLWKFWNFFASWLRLLKNTTIIEINLLILGVQLFRRKSILKSKVKHAKIILLMQLGDAHPAVHHIPSVQKYFGTFPQTWNMSLGCKYLPVLYSSTCLLLRSSNQIRNRQVHVHVGRKKSKSNLLWPVIELLENGNSYRFRSSCWRELGATYFLHRLVIVGKTHRHLLANLR